MKLNIQDRYSRRYLKYHIFYKMPHKIFLTVTIMIVKATNHDCDNVWELPNRKLTAVRKGN